VYATTVYDALETIALRGPRSDFARWLGETRARQLAGQPLDALEHATLGYALRTGYLSGSADPLWEQASDCLARSWVELTGQVPRSLLMRLPRRVLRRQSHEVRQFHAATFQILPAKDAALEVAFGRDYVGEPRDLLWVAFVGSVALFPLGRQALAGIALGYIMATLLEYGFHRMLAHAPKQVDRLFERIGGGARREVEALKYSHAGVHHRLTFRERYDEQFSNPWQKDALEQAMRARGQAGRDVIDSSFGNSLSPSGWLKGFKVGLPVALALTALVHLLARLAPGWRPGVVFDVLTIATSTLNLPATGIFHRYMHMSRAKALAEAGPLMRWLLGTRYTAMMSRLHYGHHLGRGGNFNLVFGADALFGVLRKPTVRQLLEMKRLELFY
jgi:hypothetical protein